MTKLVSVFESLIEDDWHLERQGSNWIVREHNLSSTNSVLHVFGAQAIGFSLDQQGRAPWPFMKGLKGMHRVCDAIIVAHLDGNEYVIAIEMKSSNTGGANKQIRSARVFVQWLLDLLKLNDHWKDTWRFCGVISSTPRRQIRKGTTRRAKEPLEVVSGSEYPVVHLKNRTRLNLHDLHNRLVAQT